ncbi:hypothetical protein [Eubacterium limosum]|uniref:hypothetical protein n=1 Tax=Eubacterium limosum TaxID=1736 RepID=UPI0037185CA2
MEVIDTTQTAIILVDIAGQTTEKIGDRTNARVSPTVAYTADNSVYVAAGTEVNGSMVDGLKKIENGQNVMIRENILPQGLAQNQD